MIGYKNPIDEMILKVLKPGYNKISLLLSELYFLSKDTLVQRLFYLNNKGVITINSNTKSIFLTEKYAKVVLFNDKNNFIDAVFDYIYKGKTLPKFLSNLLTNVGFFDEFKKFKEIGKTESIKIEKYFIKCLNYYFKDTFYKEVRTIDFIYHENVTNKKDDSNGKER